MRNLSAASAVVLLILAAVMALVPVETLTGVHPSPPIAAPDSLPPIAEGTAPFFEERDEIVKIVVGEETTLRNFLDRNRLNRPWTRDQITQQLGDKNPAAIIPAGTIFRLRLTPTVTDVPGTNVAK